MITGRDEKRLIDSGMVEIVSNSRYERRHDFEWCQKVLDLQKKVIQINKYT